MLSLFTGYCFVSSNCVKALDISIAMGNILVQLCFLIFPIMTEGMLGLYLLSVNLRCFKPPTFSVVSCSLCMPNMFCAKVQLGWLLITLKWLVSNRSALFWCKQYGLLGVDASLQRQTRNTKSSTKTFVGVKRNR